MTTVAKIWVELGLDAQKYHEGLGKAASSTQSFAKTASGFLSNVASTAMGFLSAQVFSNIGQQIVGVGQAALNATMDWERLGFTMESMIAREMRMADSTLSMNDALAQAGAKSKEVLDQIQRLAIQSPFSTSAVARTFSQAMAYGFASDEAMRLTKSLLDMAAATGRSEEQMSAIGYALGQIRASDKLLMQDVRQLINAGVDVNSILAEMGYSLGDVGKAAISSADFIEAFNKVSERDYSGAVDRMAKSWSGLLGALADVKEIGLRTLFQSAFEKLQPVVSQFTEWMLGPGLEKLGEIGAKLGEFIGWIIDVGKSFQNIGDSFSGFKTILDFLSLWWETNGPGITSAAQQIFSSLVEGFEKIREKVEPFVNEVLAKIVIWLTENGPLIQQYAQTIADVFSTYVVPVVVGAFDIILPLLSGFVDVILGIDKLLMQVVTGDWAGAWETLKGIVSNALDAIWQAIIGAVDLILQFFDTSFAEGVVVWQQNWEQFKQIIEKIWLLIVGFVQDKVNSIVDAFNGIIGAIENVVGWIDNLKNSLMNLKLPDWLTPGSPTPFEIGLVGIENAMRRIAQRALPELNANLQLSPVATTVDAYDARIERYSAPGFGISDYQLESLARFIVAAIQRGKVE